MEFNKNLKIENNYGQYQNYNGEDCLIIPLKNIICGKVEQITEEYPRITLEYWGRP